MAWLFWIGGSLVFAVIETLTADLTFLMIAGGALGGGVAAALGASLPVQVIVFAVVSTLLLLAVRPWARRRMASTAPQMRTNAEALVGSPATAITVVDDQGGRVRLSGGEWSARLAPAAAGQDGPVDPGAAVTVTQIDGAVAIVVPALPEQSSQEPVPHGR
ncbi:NfeD family protein [Actinomyces wuliandei]|uniref:NfeD family protein n=1 Tax=Actinomyces wuliandei TaxID=2057743 RepID=UPI000FDAD53F|nr:NfeD family protein [Actinomyces wuliandei]